MTTIDQPTAYAARDALLRAWQGLNNSDQTAASVRFTGYMLGVLAQSKPGDILQESVILEGLKYGLPPWRNH